MALTDDKVKGRQITIAESTGAARVIDLMVALKESMRTTQRGKREPKEGKRKKA